MGPLEFEALLPGREEVHLTVTLDGNGQILSCSLTGLGPLSLLRLIDSWRPLLVGRLSEVPLPDGQSTGELLLIEVLLKAKGLWSPPCTEKTLCHCRSVATQTVDQAIVSGAMTPERVSELTMASTGCGTCRPDVQSLIDYRLTGQSSTTQRRAV